MNLVQRGDGITILDDTYNANPQSMRAAISVLADSRSAWKLAVLGDMFELGPTSPRPPHRSGGVSGGSRKIDCLVAVGEQARHRSEGADLQVPVYCRLSLCRQEGRPGDPSGTPDPAGQHHPGQGLPGDADGGAGGTAFGVDAGGGIRTSAAAPPGRGGGRRNINETPPRPQRGRYDRHIWVLNLVEDFEVGTKI